MPFRPLSSKFLSPGICLGLLLCAGWVQRDVKGVEHFAGFHVRAREAIEAIPLKLGPWMATERKPDQSALALLKPNILRSFTLQDTRPDAAPGRLLFFTVVQCRRASDMLGHYPPICYPAVGDTLRSSQQKTWKVDGLSQPITGTEYEFERLENGKARRRIVCFFMVVPGKGFAPDMKTLEFAADDYQQRYYGAAQFQVVFDSLAGQGRPEAERDETFTTLIGQAVPAIETLLKP